ncbi:MAG: energy transducer TonB [Frateuria sp.]|uniref:energy transducer TonB n=1 Tax=Frateuria sp. TaxID=2211372 RepID=UPI001843DD8B|nr:energy transducer TonB [Frateuria sp.]NUO74065.1 energy transducer TonB [Frateuria sp.]NUR22351.1 energy transducer TonB [Frateuria sp.]
MSSAYLASSRAHAHQPDLVRIAALSVAMAIDLTVFVAATRPLPPMAMPRPASAPMGIRVVDPPKAAPAPPPLRVAPLTHHVRAPVAVAPPVAVVPRASDEGNTTAPPVQAPTLLPPSANIVPDSVSTEPVEASLAYRSAPLSFPAQAIRQHMHGTVLLRVLVDETGKPTEVVVEQSSGYKLLDNSAREQVLASWRFEPASVGGHAIRAWARVPVSFELRQL